MKSLQGKSGRAVRSGRLRGQVSGSAAGLRALEEKAAGDLHLSSRECWPENNLRAPRGRPTGYRTVLRHHTREDDAASYHAIGENRLATTEYYRSDCAAELDARGPRDDRLCVRPGGRGGESGHTIVRTFMRFFRRIEPRISRRKGAKRKQNSIVCFATLRLCVRLLLREEPASNYRPGSYLSGVLHDTRQCGISGMNVVSAAE